MAEKKKIAIIHAGGTTCMTTDQKTLAIKEVRPENRFETIHRFLPEIQKFTKVDFFPLYDLGSSEMTPLHWSELAEFIRAKLSQYEGFVVIHGTNTLSYTASALSFALRNLSVPVVFTGGNRPISDLSSDARQNIVFASMVATMDLAEVAVVYGRKILRGNCSKKESESYASAFTATSSHGKIGDVHRTIALYEQRIVRRKRNLLFKPNFNGNVIVIKAVPGLDVRAYECMMDALDGVIIEGYGPGHVPESDKVWMQFIERLNFAGKPVVMTSQMYKSEVNLHAYQQGERLLKSGVIPAGEMTLECTYAKLLWCLGQNMKLPKIRETMMTNLAREMSTEKEAIEVW